MMLRNKHILFYMFLIFLILPASQSLGAKRNSLERWLQDKWCRDHGGTTNARLNDRSRCDCLTWKNGIKIEFKPEKWMDTLGVALNYSMRTGLRGGVVLVIKHRADKAYWVKLKTTVLYFQLPIDLWLWERYQD